MVGDSVGTVTAGIMGASTSDNDLRFFAGNGGQSGSAFDNRLTAPFRVYEDGKLVANDVEINGQITATGGYIIGTLSLGRDGILTTWGQDASTSKRLTLDNEKIYINSHDGVHGSHDYHTSVENANIELYGSFSGYINTPGSSNTMNIWPGLIQRHQTDNSKDVNDPLYDITEYALFVNKPNPDDQNDSNYYRLCVTTSHPASPDAYTIYIVTTGTSKGVYVGSTKIA